MSDEHPTGYVDLTSPDPAPAAPANEASADLPPTEATNAIPGTDSPAEPPAPAPAKAPAFSMDALPDLRETLQTDSVENKSRAEFTTVYDVIDQLESMLDDAKTSMFSPGTVKVDRDEFANQLAELKKLLPVQLERASALMREAERRLESAQTQANAVVASAQSRAADMVKEANEQAQFLAGQENVTELARQKARTILEQAQAKSDHLTQGADQYCATVMEGLSQQLGKLTQDVQAGLNVLEERQRSAGEQMPKMTLNDYPEAQ